MRLLLDTHTLIWWVNDDRRLSRAADEAIGDFANDVFVSSVSAFEISTKYRLGKLNEAGHLANAFATEVREEDFSVLLLDDRSAQRAGLFNFPHRDPFHRLLIAQAQVEGMTLVSNEKLFDSFDVKRLW